MQIKKPGMGGLKSTTVSAVEGVISPSQNNSASPMKVGSQAVVKTPKAKKMGQSSDKPSLFFKSEEFQGVKKPSIHKLRKFLEKQRSKR
jgi:hypothetical protein